MITSAPKKISCFDISLRRKEEQEISNPAPNVVRGRFFREGAISEVRPRDGYFEVGPQYPFTTHKYCFTLRHPVLYSKSHLVL